NARRFRLLCVALLLGGGWLWYRGMLRPDPQRLETWATAALQDVFGPATTHGRVDVDVLEGVTVADLRVPSRDGTGDALFTQGVVDGTFQLRASPTSTRFRPGFVLRLERFHGTATPEPNARIQIDGGFSPAGLGFEGTHEIRFKGKADVDLGRLDMQADWEDL